MTITHTFVSAKADGGDATLVRPSNWNAGHTIAGTLAWDGATVTASTPLLDLSQTWNAGAVAFTAIKLNVTNTASAAASRLIDIQKGGNTAFHVEAAVPTTRVIGNGVSNANVMEVWYDPAGTITQHRWDTFGNYFLTGQILLGGSLAGGNITLGTNVVLASGGAIVWTNGVASGGIGDIWLYRDAAGILAQRNSTNAQTFRVYNTFTDASNYERGTFDWTTTANRLTMGTQASGTGTTRDAEIKANTVFLTGDSDVQMYIGGNKQFGWTSGNAIFSAGSLSGSGYIQWAGQARVTSDFSVTSSAALTNVTGLAVALQAGHTYSFIAYLSCTDAAAGGVKAAIAGSGGLTATNIIYDGYVLDTNTTKGQANATALGGTVASSTTTATTGVVIEIQGTITVNVAGTLNVQFAQNTSNATASVVKRGSWLMVYDMP